MVAGDLVNTASRVQSVATARSVLVGDATRRATDAAVRYEPAGTHELKGKAEPMALFRALQVVAGRSGVMRVEGLEAPFVGRDRELRMLKDLFHSTVDHLTPQLVTVSGVAGVGKSRLSWEFEKYVDGLAEERLVAPRPVPVLRRGRHVLGAGGHDADAGGVGGGRGPRGRRREARRHPRRVRRRRRASAAGSSPGSAQLLGLDDRPTTGQDDQFAAWRLFVERMSDSGPVVLVFEDLQWADTSLLDFVDYLLEWSRNHPIFVLALTRPELAERRPTWGAGRRNFSSLYLEPLGPRGHGAAARGPGAGPAATGDQGDPGPGRGHPAVRRRDGPDAARPGSAREGRRRYRPTGPIDDLEVPETLHGLIAARLDGLARPSAGWSRTPRCWASRSRPRRWPRCPA